LRTDTHLSLNTKLDLEKSKTNVFALINDSELGNFELDFSKKATKYHPPQDIIAESLNDMNEFESFDATHPIKTEDKEEIKKEFIENAETIRTYFNPLCIS